MSQVWKQFEQMMSDKDLVKTAADKKDQDYAVVPDKAGPDTQVEETGYELVEMAHPDQVQVANSRLNDGIVENGVEQQKIMIDVATRAPRGVLAEVMSVLVKAANTLEDDMTDESLKMAKEIDTLLNKLAQEQKMPEVPNMIGGQGAGPSAMDTAKSVGYGAAAGEAALLGGGAAALYGMGAGALLIPGLGWIAAGAVGAGALGGWLASKAKEIDNLYEGFDKAGDYLGDLDYGSWYQSTSGTEQGKQLQGIINKLLGYAKIKENMSFDDPNYNATLLKKTFEAVNYVTKITPAVERAIESATDKGSDKEEAAQVWNGLLRQSQMWLTSSSKELVDKGLVKPDVKSKDMPVAQQPQAAPGAASKAAPSKSPGASRHNYSVSGPEVMDLQKALGLTGNDVDGKFGPKTFDKLIQEAQQNYNLKSYLDNAQHYAKGYQGWDVNAVIEALHNIEKFKNSGPKEQSSLPPLVPPPAEQENKNWERLDEHRFKDKNTGKIYTLNNPVQ